jgi:hypothetical protein
VFENRVLRRILVAGGQRELLNNLLHQLHSSPDIFRMIYIRRILWAGNVARIRENNSYMLLVLKKEVSRQLGRRRRRWVDNIMMDLGEIVGMLRIGLIWLRIGTSGRLLCVR